MGGWGVSMREDLPGTTGAQGLRPEMSTGPNSVALRTIELWASREHLMAAPLGLTCCRLALAWFRANGYLGA